MKVIWSPLAVERLWEIEQFLGDKNPAVALRTVAEIIEMGDSLVQMAKRGRSVPELGQDNVREVIVGSYRVVYMVNDDEQRVEIVTVVHGRQRFPTDLPPDR